MPVQSRETLVAIERAPTLDSSLVRAQWDPAEFQSGLSWLVRSTASMAPHEIRPVREQPFWPVRLVLWPSAGLCAAHCRESQQTCECARQPGHEVSQSEGNEEGMNMKLDGSDHATLGAGQIRRV